ncbi:MAG: O-antigen ligase family protein [Desulfuromonadaceae bacterium]|nr:O-antigen ligase family protein [Desulfuromonadaceae bacterium]
MDKKPILALLPISLLVISISFFIIEEAKTRNNIYYITFLAPTIFLFVKYKSFSILKENKELLLFFLLSVISTIISGNHPVDNIKHALYLCALLVGLHTCHEEQTLFDKALFSYPVIVVFFFSIAAYHWTEKYLASGSFKRITLYAAAANPVHASLMILVGWVGFWLFWAIPKYKGHKEFLFYIMTGGALFICLVFQSRSALVGVFIALSTWIILNKEKKIGLIAVAFLSAGALTTGLHEAFLNRGSSYRLDIWQNALSNIDGIEWLIGTAERKEHLYLGKFYHEHSAYLSILIKNGLLGLIPFIVFSVNYIKQGIRTRSNWFILSLIGWGALITTSNGLIDSLRPLWIYFWIPTFLALIDYSRPTGAQTERDNALCAKNKGSASPGQRFSPEALP